MATEDRPDESTADETVADEREDDEHEGDLHPEPIAADLEDLPDALPHPDERGKVPPPSEADAPIPPG